mmetsp:Transcript_44867/g.117697  ORF Transcript_44867/g.117697 Transcript_44867/m.117697 type:complete len:113 (+) Transcript_44867:3-341(+)
MHQLSTNDALALTTQPRSIDSAARGRGLAPWCWAGHCFMQHVVSVVEWTPLVTVPISGSVQAAQALAPAASLQLPVPAALPPSAWFPLRVHVRPRYAFVGVRRPSRVGDDDC